MNEIENGVIKYQIDFERYKNGAADDVIALIDEASAKISKLINSSEGVYTKARYRLLRKALREIAETLRERAGNSFDIEGLIENELKRQEAIMLKAFKGKQKGLMSLPSVEQVMTSAMFKPVTQYMTYDSFLNGIQEGFYNVWDSALRAGYLSGRNTDSIVRDVIGGLTPETRLANPGSIQWLRNSIYSNTRTVLQSFANEARMMAYRENEKYFGAKSADGKKYRYEYLATLDRRTCLPCGDLDGKLYERIDDCPTVPRHSGCRCLVVPYFETEGEMRASENGYVSSKVTFEEWLGKQSDSVKKDVLGKSRFEMYKQGTRMAQFVDNGRTLTLEQLKERNE